MDKKLKYQADVSRAQSGLCKKLTFYLQFTKDVETV